MEKKRINSNFKQLKDDLGVQRIGRLGIKFLEEDKKWSSSLTELNLAQNNISFKGFASLSSALRRRLLRLFNKNDRTSLLYT